MANNNITIAGIELKYTHSQYVVIAFLGLTSNVLLLIAFIKDPLKCFRNSGTYLLMSLSVSDIFTCIFIPFFHRAVVFAGYDSENFGLFSLSFGAASLTSIASISIDRFLMVVFPMKHRYWLKGKVMIAWLSGIWLGAFILPLLRFFFNHKMNGMLPINCFNTIVIIISAVMYAATYLKLKKHSKNIAQQNSTDRRVQEIKILKEKQFLKTIILIACIAFFCILPSMIYFQLDLSLGFTKDSLVSKIFLEILALIFCINFTINPLIYIVRLPNYRRTFYLVYCKR